MFENIIEIASFLSCIASIASFFLAFCERKKCEKIKDECIEIINNNLITGNHNIVSNDKISIENIKNFDNRKSV